MTTQPTTSGSNGISTTTAGNVNRKFSEVTGIFTAKAIEIKDLVLDMAHDEEKRKKVLSSPYFAQAMNTAAIVATSRHRALRLVHRVYQKLKATNSHNELWGNITESTKLMARMIRSYANGRYKHVPWSVILKATGAMIYLVWIIDLIPDFIPVAGLLDDAVVLLWVFSVISEELDRFKIWEANQD